MTSRNTVAVAIIGFGEVGTALSRGFVAADGYTVAVFDILFKGAAGSSMIDKGHALGVRPCGSAAEAAAGAHVVISAVTASSAFDVAHEAGSYLQPGQIFMDLNSVSPHTKRKDAAAIEPCGADYVESAVMAPIGPYGIKVPMVLGGRRAADLKALLEGAGMRIEVGTDEIGRASALKMCRSVMVKGFEALAVECFTAARLYGVEEDVLASLKESYPGLDWEEFVGYKIGRVVEHGRRRAAEMRESADTVSETGMTPFMSAATAQRIDWVADLVAANPSMKGTPDESWRDTIDTMIDKAKLRGLTD